MRSQRVRVLSGALVVALIAGTTAIGVGGCSSRPPTTEEVGADATSPAAEAGQFAGRRSGPIEFRAYSGDVADDARLATAVDAMTMLVTPTIDAAEERAGLAFTTGRGAAVVFVDSDLNIAGEVNSRLLDGLRRPVIRISARHVVSGAFVPEVHFPPLVVQAVVLAVAGERMAPGWLRIGLATEVGGAFDWTLHERVLGGPRVRTQPDTLFPETPAHDDALVATVRVRALARIARGERALARFVTTRLSGASSANALRDVGVHDADFLEAAAETERDRALAAVDLVGPLALLAQARDALASNEASRGIPSAGLLAKAVDDGDANAWVATDARIVLAEYRLLAGDAKAARTLLATALASPAHLVRRREARLLEARSAAADGDAREASSLYRRYAADYPSGVGTDEALRAIGVARKAEAELVRTRDAAERERKAAALAASEPAETGPAKAGNANSENAARTNARKKPTPAPGRDPSSDPLPPPKPPRPLPPPKDSSESDGAVSARIRRSPGAAPRSPPSGGPRASPRRGQPRPPLAGYHPHGGADLRGSNLTEEAQSPRGERGKRRSGA